MQGGTVERAWVVAETRDLTRGWSYTALSRARDQTRLLVVDPAGERDELAPSARSPAPERSEWLAQLARRMRERDDEDLAIDQLRGGDLAADATAARVQPNCTMLQPAHERGDPRGTKATIGRLHELALRVESLRAQRDALPLRDLGRLTDLDERASALTDQLNRLREALATLPTPRRRLGRAHDPASTERARLSAAIVAGEDERARIHVVAEVIRETLGEPEQLRAEKDTLDRAVDEATSERQGVVHALSDQEVVQPGGWAREAFGERPSCQPARGQWDAAVREIAQHRIENDIDDPVHAIGPIPENDATEETRSAADDRLRDAQNRLNLDQGIDIAR
jgi:hypothetical protein